MASEPSPTGPKPIALFFADEPENILIAGDQLRWGPGDWDYDPDKHEWWTDPATLRLNIGTDRELEIVADAVVQKMQLLVLFDDDTRLDIVSEHGSVTQHVVIDNLSTLLRYVQEHRLARLAHTALSGTGHWDSRTVDSRWVTNHAGEHLPSDGSATTLSLNKTQVASYFRCKRLHIRCALYLHAAFHRGTHIDSCEFHAPAVFRNSTFHRQSHFWMNHFYDETSFDAVVFDAYADFMECVWYKTASFSSASFLHNANFTITRFHDTAHFNRSKFIGKTDFSGVVTKGEAAFKSVSFAAAASFSGGKFLDKATFENVRFRETVSFRSSRFQSTMNFASATFCGFSDFAWSTFPTTANFARCRVCVSAALVLSGARARENVRLSDSRIDGDVFLTGMTLDERLTFDGAQIGQNARLGFSQVLLRGGATIELEGRHLLDRRGNQLVSGYDTLLRWLGIRTSDPLIKGEDSKDPEALARAADDYELLAANYARQPSADEQEDLCRWRAHELRRRATKLHRLRAVRVLWRRSRRQPFAAWPRWAFAVAFSQIRFMKDDPSPALLRPVYEPIMCFVFNDLIYRYLIMRTCLGYLLRVHRVIVSGIALMLSCALVYGVFASDATVVANANAASLSTFGFWDRVFFGIYFSLTTFVTLGYGDYAPQGWFKLITGVQALLGVTLLALFTVAWGRKMVR